MAKQTGLDLERTLAVLADNENGWSAAVARSRGQALIERQHGDVKCALDVLLKDLSYALGADAGGSFPVLHAALRAFERASAAGLGELDMSAVGELVLYQGGPT